MRILVQRVSQAGVTIERNETRSIGCGFVVFVGVGQGDTEAEASWLAEKTANLRIFSNAEGKFDLSLLDVKGSALVISQFTLYGDCAKGRRPDFTAAAAPAEAKLLYEKYVRALEAFGIPVKTGEFGAHMDVALVNDGPVTISMERNPQPA